MGENNSAELPTALYGVALLMPAVAYCILQFAIIKSEREKSMLAKAIGTDLKGKISPLLYMAAIGLAFLKPWISCAIYTLVALIWLVPDRRIENMIRD